MPITIITERDAIKSALPHFKDTYCKDGVWNVYTGPLAAWWPLQPSEIWAKISVMDLDTVSIAEFNQVLKWADVTCDNCRQDVKAVIQVGHMPNYDSSTAKLCLDCAKEAYDKLNDYFGLEALGGA